MAREYMKLSDLASFYNKRFGGGMDGLYRNKPCIIMGYGFQGVEYKDGEYAREDRVGILQKEKRVALILLTNIESPSEMLAVDPDEVMIEYY